MTDQLSEIRERLETVRVKPVGDASKSTAFYAHAAEDIDYLLAQLEASKQRLAGKRGIIQQGSRGGSRNSSHS